MLLLVATISATAAATHAPNSGARQGSRTQREQVLREASAAFVRPAVATSAGPEGDELWVKSLQVGATSLTDGCPSKVVNVTTPDELSAANASDTT